MGGNFSMEANIMLSNLFNISLRYFDVQPFY